MFSSRPIRLFRIRCAAAPPAARAGAPGHPCEPGLLGFEALELGFLFADIDTVFGKQRACLPLHIA